MPVRRPLLLFIAALIAAGGAVTFLVAGSGSPSTRTADRCPRGMVRERDPGGHDGGECARLGHPESQREVMALNGELGSRDVAPFTHVRTGAALAAANDAARLRASQSSVPNSADGTWTPLGNGPLFAGDTTYDTSNGSTQEGFRNLSGRVEDFAYDSIHGRLFAAPVNGGVWQSDDLGKTWRSVGDGLPTQVVGSVAYTTANGGTIIALTGDPAYGGDSSSGLGIYRSTDDGATWQRGAGSPDGVLGFQLAVDPTDANKIYAATGAGLFRSTDGGASWTNVMLPTGPCAGHTLDYTQPAFKDCFLANEVTDVVVHGPNTKHGGVPGSVVAAVGWRAGQKLNADGSMQSPNNGIYVSIDPSDPGSPGTFQKVNTTTSNFADKDQSAIGRVALGIANGPDQNHQIIYALVQDANKFNGKTTPDNLDEVPTGAPGSTVLNGIYVSQDFGFHWTQMESSTTLDNDVTSGSALEPAGKGLSYQPGVQAWYNEWIQPDPTSTDANGVPERVALGLEEIWESDGPVPGAGPQPQNSTSFFRVIGRYWNTCDFVQNGAPKCGPGRGNGSAPTDPNTTTTHPDQHAGLFIPDGKGGVTLVAGSDGGVYTQHVDAGTDFSNNNWGDGAQGSGAAHLHTLQPYDVEMAKDGTAYMGMQDNGEGKILPDGSQKEVYGGDGFFTAVDPDKPDVAYEEYTGGVMSVTQDGGRTWSNEDPQLTSAQFVTPFAMDPTDAQHLIIGGREVDETTKGPNTVTCFDPSCSTVNDNWQTVFDLGTQQHPGDASASSSSTDPDNQTSADMVQGPNAYVGYCGFCDTLTQGTPFKRGIATNVGGSAAPAKASTAGWHIAAASGLPNRLVTSIAIDPGNPRNIWVTLGGYGRKWAPPGAVGDALSDVGSGHVFMSTDAGQSFTDVSGDLPDSPANWVILHGGQLVVGTDVGAFISSSLGGGGYAPLGNLPRVPVLHLATKPGDPSTLVAATYGRGAYTYRFGSSSPVAISAPSSSGGGGGSGGGTTTRPSTTKPTACTASHLFRSVTAKRSGGGVTFTSPHLSRDSETLDIFQVSSGRHVVAERLVARLHSAKSKLTWTGRANRKGRTVRDGYYFARLTTKDGARSDVRRITLQRAHGRFSERPSFYRRATCDLLSSYKLLRPVFGGTSSRSIGASYRVASAGKVSIVVRHGSKVVKRFAAKAAKPGRTYRVTLSAKGLARGNYSFALSAVSGRRTLHSTLVSRRL